VAYGYLDESGDTGYGTGSSDVLVAAVVVVGHPHRLRKAVTKTRRSFGRLLRGAVELKAAHDAPRITERLLTRAAEIGFQAVAVVLDKRNVSPPEDLEDLYRIVCARAVREVLERFGDLFLTLDKRYTTPKLQARLDQAIREGVRDMPGVFLEIRHQESEREKVLQVADAVAWTVHQHEQGEKVPWEVIQERVVVVRM